MKRKNIEAQQKEFLRPLREKVGAARMRGVVGNKSFTNPSPALRASSPKRKKCLWTTPLPACGVLPPQGGQSKLPCALKNERGEENRGFTLIELLVVVLIIGILAAIALPQYQFAVAKSKFAEVLLLTRDIKQQQEIFFMEHGHYAADCEELTPELPTGAYLYDSAHLAFTKDDTTQITCSNGGATRVGVVAPNANLELWLDQAERTPVSSKGFCRAKTETGHKLCAQMGQIEEGKKTYNYYF